MRMNKKNGVSRSAFFSRAKKKFARGAEFLLAMVMILSVTSGALSALADDDLALTTTSAPVTATAAGDQSDNDGSYNWYRDYYADKPLYTGEDIVIPAASYVDTNMNVTKMAEYTVNGVTVSNPVVLPEASAEQEVEDAKVTGNESNLELIEYDPGYITYKVTVPESALYEIALQYCAIEGKGSDMEREIEIDGVSPFVEATYLAFSRIWQDTQKVGEVFDTAGNEIRPNTDEAPEWTVKYLNDDKGYYFDAFRFYLEAGEHEIKLISVKEPMLLGEIIVGMQDELPTYAEVKADYAAKGYQAASGEAVKIEAEETFRKSASSLYPYHSRSSAATTGVSGDFTYDHTQVNVIGGERWEQAGQWISWQITVPTTGLYTISLRGRQNVNKSMSSGRCLRINGEIPFAEAKNCGFYYDADFRFYTLGESETESAEPFQFYFEAGKTYEMSLQVNLGVIEDLARRLDDSVAELMKIYRRLLMLIGNEPDEERDYGFKKVMPEAIENMKVQADELLKILDDMLAVTGERNSNMAVLERAADRLYTMHDHEVQIAKQFSQFKSDISTIAEWILDLNYQPLELDYILVAPVSAELPDANAGFFAGLGHELRLFWSSFTTDYTSVGADATNEDAITVWFAPGQALQVVGGGREQAQILKQMIDDDFRIQYPEIPVNLQLIDISALLPATLAGKGPDVALQVVGTSPVQYAMRGAVVDLAQFADFPQISERFFDSSLVQFTYQNGVYALPETQNFQVMFYRTDVMEELGLDVPQTWADVYDIIPELQNSYMNFGYPANVNNYYTLLYQNGGTLYRGEGETLGYATNLDSPTAIATFIDYVDLYRSYKIDMTIDFQNRFRTGEMPIGIADFTTMNALSVTAPEIRGLWDFALVPGHDAVDENGNAYINRSVATSGNGCIILAKSEHQDEAWEFLKWWTSDPAQSRYCLEVEATMGIAARIPSANINVMYQQAWSTDEYKLLMTQRSWAEGVPEVPGGYYTTRHIENAFNRTYSLMTDPRETLLDYIDDINNELTKKRTEMGIITADQITE